MAAPEDAAARRVLASQGPGERYYQDQNLEELRKWARDFRGDFRQAPSGGLADLLRTLGQDLDREQWDAAYAGVPA